MTAVLNDAEVRLEHDRGLVELHQAGDGAAFTELYALHYGRLVRFCRRLTRDSHAAEEVAQEAFARAFASLDRLQGERRFYPWVTVIARRLAIDLARDRRRVEARSEIEPGFSHAAEDIAVQRIDYLHLATAVDQLTERHREVLRLRDWEGLSYDAIAKRLGVAPTTIPPLLHRARAALRREYAMASRRRGAAWLHLPPLWAAARRLRDRVSTWMGHLPDPSVFAAPLAGAVLGAAVLVAPQAMRQVDTASHFDVPPIGSLHIPDLPRDQVEAAQANKNPAKPPFDNSADMVDGYVLRNAAVRPEYSALGSVYQNDPATWEERHEGVRRMPIYYRNEQTGIFIAADPSAVGPLVDHVAQR